MPSRRGSRRGQVVALTLVSTVIACGCGQRGVARIPVEGTVTFAGAPVLAGEIRFEPDAAQGHRGPVGHAVIENGKFSTRMEGCQGPPPGPLVVWINARKTNDPGRELQEPLFSDYCTRLTIDVPRGGGSAALDFDVPPTAARPAKR